ncbi:MAG: hypothetical protein IJ527_08275 [Prevotella sp.]|nr:hypothetical protein [Prevotella sp.]
MTEQEKQNREWAEEGFWTGHFHYLLQALAIAINRCQVWRLAETRDPFTVTELLEFAKSYDAEHPLPAGHFYMVTREGAIGVSPGVEYLTKWLFTPMEPGRERDFLLQEYRDKLAELAAEEEATASAATPAAGVSLADDSDETVVVDYDEEATVAAPPPLPK